MAKIKKIQQVMNVSEGVILKRYSSAASIPYPSLHVSKSEYRILKLRFLRLKTMEIFEDFLTIS
jgi:hypothetical protein